jgi:pimeloyl-ACP methyl ester carboxylesterase
MASFLDALTPPRVKTDMNSSQLVYFAEYGAGPPLLLVHGLMVTGEMFRPVIEHLVSRHRLIVPDLRGHGRSQGFPPPYSVAQLASDLSRLLDHLSIDCTSVLGYSQGGAIAQQLVLDYPQRCDRLVLACTYACNMATLRERLEGQVTPLLLHMLGSRRFAKVVIAQGMKQLDKECGNWLISLLANQNTKLMVAAWREAMAFDSRSRLAQIRCPTLIVAGAHDTAVPIHHAKMLHAGIPGSQLAIFAGADHMLIWTHANELLLVMDEFWALRSEDGDLD